MIVTTGKDFGLVYTGSKSRLLHYIDYIIERHPNKKYFIDLFTGGFAVSDYILSTRKSVKVIANDISKGLMDLYKKCFVEKNGMEEIKEVAFKFIDKDKFKEIIDDESDYPSWYKALISLVWSFGASIGKKVYAYSEVREELIQKIYTLLETNDVKPLEEFINNNKKEQYKEYITINIPKHYKEIDYKKQPFIKQRGVFSVVKKVVDIVLEEFSGSGLQMDAFSRLGAFFKILEKGFIATYDDLELENNDNRLYIYNYSYEDLISKLPKEVLDNAVIYCDIPYNTVYGKTIYNKKVFDYEKFWNWFKQVDVPCYVSEYSVSGILAEKDYQVLKEEKLGVSLSGGGTSSYSTEKLFYNRNKDYEPTFEDMLFNENK
jgi:hypothetical protein